MNSLKALLPICARLLEEEIEKYSGNLQGDRPLESEKPLETFTSTVRSMSSVFNNVPSISFMTQLKQWLTK
jgi:hypothetical protein